MFGIRTRGVACGLLFLLLILGLLWTVNAPAAEKADNTIPRILLVGDSWPAFMSSGISGAFWQYDHGSAFRDILPEMGYGQWSDIGDTAVAGSMITQWSTNEPTGTPFGIIGKLEWIRRELMAHPTIDIVHLGLGGNDYIRGDFQQFVYYTLDEIYIPFEWQTISFDATTTSGTFRLIFQGQTTAPIAFGATSAVVQSALEALPNIGVGNIKVEDARGLPTYFCAFQGILANTAVPMMTADSSALTGGAVTVNGVLFDHGWKETWGTESPAEYAFAYAIAAQLQIIVEYTLDSRPDVRVVLTDYDYLDAQIAGADVLAVNTNLANSGHIKLELMNTIIAKTQYAHRCFFLNTYGLMQWWFGYPCNFELTSVAPNEVRKQTTLPEEQYYGPQGTPGTMGTISLPGNYIGEGNPNNYVPWTGGDLNYAGPAISILYNFGKSANDPQWARELAAKGNNIHLHKEGYKVFARFAVETYYGAWLDLPKVLSVKPLTSPLTKAEAIEFEVTFSEAVHGVDISDFSLLTANGDASIEDVNPTKDASTYIVTVNLGTTFGTIGLAVNDNGSITAIDDGSPLAGDVDGSFIYGEKFTRATLPVAAWPSAFALLFAALWAIRRTYSDARQ